VFVSCDNCDTEYELDDAKIPAGGARLRCKNCDHSFVITPPEASDLQSADDLAHDALSTEVPGEVDPDPEREAAPEEDFDPDGESEWVFNDVVETSEPEVGEEASESAFDQGGEWDDLSTAEDVVDDLLGPAGAIDADAAAAVDDLLGEIDSADSQLGEIDSADSQLGESSGDLTAGSELPSAGLDLGDADATDDFSGDLAADGGDALDEFSDWGSFDQPAKTDASELSEGSKSLQAPAERDGASAERDGANAEPRVEIAVAMVDDSSTSVRWTDRISEIAGWGAVCLMMIVALVGGLAPSSSDVRAPAGSWSGAGFEADQIVGRWVDNAVAGSIYVVSGRIRGAPSSDRAARKAVGIRLIDTAGQEIDRALIPLAPVIPERILRESSPSELDAFQTRRAGRIAAVGERWASFEAVLTDLPQFAGRFELQALDP
jgi:predicted Zn finger-like uncharacterized protein